MSINIGLVSDKPEFTNFFSENVTLPINSEAVLVKANMDLPLLTLTSVTVPIIVAAQRGDTACEVEIDGIVKDITWTNIYDAHTALAADDIDAGVTADEYFSGNFEYIPNNQLHVISVGGQIKSKLNFPLVLGTAIESQYEFYTVEVHLDKKATDLSNIGSGRYTSRNVANTADNYIEFTQTSGYKLVATYTPQKLLDNTLTTFNWASAGDVINWTGTNGKLENTGVNTAQGWFNGTTNDLNGGWYQFKPTIQTGNKMATGFVFQGVGLNLANDEFQPTATYEPEVFDVGIQFETDAAGVGLYKIIDGHVHNTFSHGGIITDVVTPKFEPANAKHKFQNGDSFFLQIQRGNLYNDSTSFIVNIYQGNIADITHANTTKIYTSEHNLRSPAITPNIGFMDDPTVAGDFFDSIQYVPRTADTDAQAEFQNQGIPSAQALGQFVISPNITEDTGGLISRNFWSAFGIYTDDDDLGSNFNKAISTDSVNQTLSLTIQTNFTDSNTATRYFLGNTEISNIFSQNAENTTVVNTTSPQSLANLPKELKVAINNLPIKSFQGQYINTSLNKPISGGENRVIGTIPLPEVDDTAVSIPIVYEPFNLLYRPLNNVQPFNFNQVFCEIYFQDFDTNQRRKFGSVNGHLTLDINVRQGARPPRPQNNLVPV